MGKAMKRAIGGGKIKGLWPANRAVGFSESRAGSGSRFHAEAEVKTGLCAPLRSATRKRFGCKCVRFGIPFSRNPRNPDVGKLLEQGARFRVQGSDVFLANLRAAVYLVDYEF